MITVHRRLKWCVGVARLCRSSTAVGLLSIVLVCVTLDACRKANRTPTFRSGQYDYALVPVATGLRHPWSLTFLPGGDLLVTERVGGLKIVRAVTLDTVSVAGLPPVFVEGQGGLLDAALHPAFDSTRLVYFSMSKPSEDSAYATTAVIRARLEGEALHNVEDVFVAEAWGQGFHFGSRIAFDAEGYLFVTVGDRFAEAIPSAPLIHPAQSLDSHAGKVLRLSQDGTAPPDNPFVDTADARPEIWTYGHRNPQGLLIHPTTGDVWVTEHGPRGGDEINLIVRGRNYGWPVVGYGTHYDHSRIYAGTDTEEMEHPAFAWIPAIGPSGLAIYQGDRFPGWRGNLFSGSIIERAIIRIVLHSGRVTAIESLATGSRRIRDVENGDFVKRLGRRGGGPGEFVFLSAVWPRGDTIEALDGRLRRVTRFLPDGTVEIVSVATGSVRDLSLSAGPLGQGWALGGVLSASYGERDRIVVRHFDRSGDHLVLCPVNNLI